MLKVTNVSVPQNTTVLLVDESEDVIVWFSGAALAIGGLSDLSNPDDRFFPQNPTDGIVVPRRDKLYGYQTNPTATVKMLTISKV